MTLAQLDRMNDTLALENARLHQEIHSYANLVQRLYGLVMDDEARDEKALENVFNEINDFIAKKGVR